MIRRVFVSDIHMSHGKSLGTPEEYEWFDKEDAGNFSAFLDFVRDQEYDELVLLGDIMDNWLYPISEAPPPFQAIASASHVTPIINKLKGLAGQMSITYVSGNHDMAVMDNASEDFRNTYFPGIRFQKFYKTADGIFAQHGHQYVMWNAEDPERRKVPLGYYITRLVASVAACTDSMTYTIPEIVRTLSQSKSLRTQLVHAPINFLTGKLKDAGVKVSGSTLITDTPELALTIAAVKKTYANLADAWENSPSHVGPWESIWYEMAGLQGIANDLAFKNGDRKVVIFGHTHGEELLALESARAVSGYPLEPVLRWGLYANCGCWADNNDPKKPYSYVVTEYDKGKHTVTLNHWNDPLHSNPIRTEAI